MAGTKTRGGKRRRRNNKWRVIGAAERVGIERAATLMAWHGSKQQHGVKLLRCGRFIDNCGDVAISGVV